MDEEIDSKFLCPICCEVLKIPILIKTCGHKFCEGCLRAIPSTGDGSIPCPVCRSSFHVERDCFRDATLEAEITKATTRCYACHQQFSLLHFNRHSVSCSKRITAPRLTPIAHTTQQINPTPNRSTFQCPLCGAPNLDYTQLLTHVNTTHPHSTAKVVCPVCASMPWGVSNQASQDFVRHLNLRHKFEYDTYVDYEQDDDTTLQAAIESSLTEQ